MADYKTAMGRGRGGLYAFDLLDRLFGVLEAQSAKEVLPQFQEIHAGDVIPIGKEGGFPVRHVEPERSLVLAGDEGNVRWSWEFGLYPEDRSTRLVSRNRVALRGGVWHLLIQVIDPAALIMTRQMLINLRKRAERLAPRDTAPSFASSPAE